MRAYMPPEQRGLVDWVEAGPSIREACRTGPARTAYTAALDSLAGFRSAHLVLAARYICSPAAASRGRAAHLADQVS